MSTTAGGAGRERGYTIVIVFLLLAIGLASVDFWWLNTKNGEDREAIALTTQVARVENLFDPFVPLGDPDRWLMELEPVPYRNASRALLKILDLDKEARLRRDRRAGRLEIETFGDRIPLSHLSAGYQSVVALAVDVMSVLFHSWSSMEVAEGIVVIDELGAHLHPR